MDYDNQVELQLAELKSQHAILQENYAALLETMAQQAKTSEHWLAQRTRELELEALEQKKAETLQRVFYRIAERATAGLTFYAFLQTVHGLLNELIYAKNCYVCLYNAQKNTLDFPYYVDERDSSDVMQYNDVPYRLGLTEYVLRTGKTQIIDAPRLESLKTLGAITEASGDLSFSTWLGVPMQIGGATGGALVVQSYEAGICHSLEDAAILSFVANHVSSAIERYQAIDSLRQSETRYRTVIDNVGVGVTVIQDEKVVFANPSLVRIIGHQLESLLFKSFVLTVHPDDTKIALEAYQRLLDGAKTTEYECIRIVTANGEVRSLELSAVKIVWDQREASLLFVVDVTARQEAERDQRLALQKQSELNDLKARFIEMASHEFRTPLATIHGSVELLQHYDDRMSMEKKQLTLKKIDEAVARMTHMLENVLAIGRRDTAHVELQPSEILLSLFLQSLIDELRGAMTKQFDSVNLIVRLPPATKRFFLDESLIRTIVGNLLSNAVKYSPDGGDVCLEVQELGDRLCLSVTDHGIGIPASDLPHLFESFHRASNVGLIGGTGLGLAIVKQAVTSHKGKIEVHSEVGEGSCFSVTLENVHISRQASHR
jgi:PAS domain S-box-containing protein